MSCGGTGTCGCGSRATNRPATPVASINGIALHAPGEDLTDEDLRERAWAELLRQEAVRRGLLPRAATLEMPMLDDAQQQVIHAMLEADVPQPVPNEDEARRYYDGHASRFVQGARVRLRHILFAVTDGVDVEKLAVRAEQALLELTHKDAAPGRFAALARELSNCPSGADGGELGWVAAQEIAPELAHALFHAEGAALASGLKQRLVHSRYGLHIVDVQERDAGRLQPYAQAREGIAMLLAQQSRARGLHQYIRLLAGRALVEGVDLEAADSPLVQ